MKKLCFALLGLVLVLSACSPDGDLALEGNQAAPAVQASSQDPIHVGQMTSPNTAQLVVSISNLEQASLATFGFLSAYSFGIEHGDTHFWLVGKGEFPNGDVMSFGFSLSPDGSGGLLMAASASTQSCTSDSDCKGCKLTTVDASSGYCDCIASNTWKDPSNGSCSHSVSQSTALSFVAALGSLM